MKKWTNIALCAALSVGLGFAGAGAMALHDAAADTDASIASAVQGIQKTAHTSTEVETKEVPFSTSDQDPEKITVGVSTPDASTKSIQEIAADTMPSMVAITNTSVQDLNNYYGGMFGFGGFGDFGDFGDFGNGRSVESVSMGTGVIMSETDDYIYIATNAHVIEGARDLSVAFSDETAAEATIIGSDSTNDLGVIRVSKKDLSKETLDTIKVIPVGSSEALQVGESVVAIGNALGYGQSVSTGIVSALNRSIYSQDMNSGKPVASAGMIQTDASINPGNSGGALLNMKGELIGINSAKYADETVEGMGYAIPIDYASPILENLANNSSNESSDSFSGGNTEGNTVRLGISCTTVTDEYAQYYDIPTGVYVNSVEPGSAAERAGICEGDIITQINDTKIGSAEELKNALSSFGNGDSAEVTVARKIKFFGEENLEYGTLTVTFGSDIQGFESHGEAA